MAKAKDGLLRPIIKTALSAYGQNGATLAQYTSHLAGMSLGAPESSNSCGLPDTSLSRALACRLALPTSKLAVSGQVLWPFMARTHGSAWRVQRALIR
jgi:hypothetical protein